MEKIIVTSRVTKNSPAGNAGNLVKYMGTREGVEKLPLNEETVAATVRQQRLINQILKADPETKSQGLFHQIQKEVTFCGLPHGADA